MASKVDRLRAAADKMNESARKKGIKRPVAYVAGDHPELLDLGVVPTGLFAVDQAIGGGWSRGGASQVYGKRGAGKTRLAIQTLAHNQQDPEFTSVYVYVEGGDFPVEAMREAGVDLDRVIILEAEESGEDILDKLKILLVDDKGNPTNDVDFAVIDSIAAINTKAEIESIEKEGFQKSRPGTQAAFTSKLFRVLMGSKSLGRCALLIINQMRADMNAQYAGAVVLPGGKATEFYPKIEVSATAPKSGFLERPIGNKKTEVYGHTVNIQVTKNNTGRAWPHRETSYEVLYGIGPNHLKMVGDALVMAGIMKPLLKKDGTGTGYYELGYQGETLKFGKDRGAAFFETNPEACSFFQNVLRNLKPGSAGAEDNAPVSDAEGEV